ncbi:hypothetical protein IE077_003085 [Cardiosporidium cionae]|uniref:SUN domain-containing protein n=1 Tax=Cardiosporidium cionae TaxID=476202 RepID=A0ABQ7JA38_9APIC|nr:hypothetical protein IE077_003085 [Cardiosporidium cionae]|eukprot:KAF8820525.1 hypothetical protein IE077_003085 [Cardiosporidium cionae]
MAETPRRSKRLTTKEYSLSPTLSEAAVRQNNSKTSFLPEQSPSMNPLDTGRFGKGLTQNFELPCDPHLLFKRHNSRKFYQSSTEDPKQCLWELVSFLLRISFQFVKRKLGQYVTPVSRDGNVHDWGTASRDPRSITTVMAYSVLVLVLYLVASGLPEMPSYKKTEETTASTTPHSEYSGNPSIANVTHLKYELETMGKQVLNLQQENKIATDKAIKTVQTEVEATRSQFDHILAFKSVLTSLKENRSFSYPNEEDLNNDRENIFSGSMLVPRSVEWSLASLGASINYEESTVTEDWIARTSGMIRKLARFSIPWHMLQLFHEGFSSVPALQAQNPGIILNGNVQPGNCFHFSGSNGNITIELAVPIHLSELVVEYPPPSSTPYHEMAPQNFKVFVDSSIHPYDTNCNMVSSFDTKNEARNIDGPNTGRFCLSPGNLLLRHIPSWHFVGNFRFVYPSTLSRQTFRPILSTLRNSEDAASSFGNVASSHSIQPDDKRTRQIDSDSPISRVKFSFDSNYGGAYTCIYRLGVLGEAYTLARAQEVGR